MKGCAIYKKVVVALLMTVFCIAADAQKLLEFLPSEPAKTAMIVCPGGSYFWLSKQTEGKEVARWLNDNGIAAYVLYYPTAGWTAYAYHMRPFSHRSKYPDQLRDLDSALAEVRRKGYSRVGAIGFSAGGHLVLSSAEYSDKRLAPDFVAAIYPVITMVDECVHHRSRRGLMGDWRWRNKTLRDSLSLERHAELIRCPVFMINCTDDPIVDYHNSELMDSALTANHKPHYYHQFRSGGHGFGVNAAKTSAEAITWKDMFMRWLREIIK